MSNGNRQAPIATYIQLKQSRSRAVADSKGHPCIVTWRARLANLSKHVANLPRLRGAQRHLCLDHASHTLIDTGCTERSCMAMLDQAQPLPGALSGAAHECLLATDKLMGCRRQWSARRLKCLSLGPLLTTRQWSHHSCPRRLCPPPLPTRAQHHHGPRTSCKHPIICCALHARHSRDHFLYPC